MLHIPHLSPRLPLNICWRAVDTAAFPKNTTFNKSIPTRVQPITAGIHIAQKTKRQIIFVSVLSSVVKHPAAVPVKQLVEVVQCHLLLRLTSELTIGIHVIPTFGGLGAKDHSQPRVGALNLRQRVRVNIRCRDRCWHPPWHRRQSCQCDARSNHWRDRSTRWRRRIHLTRLIWAARVFQFHPLPPFLLC